MPADATSTLRNDSPSAPERPLLGKVVDQRYRVIEHIGSGGMADVYEVEHVALGRRLAMKVLRRTRAESPQLARRFSREARAASRLDSEHVVSIHDYGILPEGFPYFVMELLHGENLRSLLDAERRLSVSRAVNVAIDVCLGLHVAHASGLVHRDLKPENLWLSRGDDGRERCILLDFGVARFDGAHTTGDGALVGTARYMSPEQIGSEHAPGPTSDLFSLGLLLYECLTGVSPFTADSLERTLFRILNDTQKPASSLVEEIPHELSAVLDRVLAKKPEERFQGALEFAASLRPFAGVARPLPALDLAAGHGLTDETLAEEPTVTAIPYGEVADGPAPGASRGRAVALSFGAGVLLGGATLFALRPDPSPSQSSSPATTPPVRASSAPEPVVHSARIQPAPQVPPTDSSTSVAPVAPAVTTPPIRRPHVVSTAAPSAPKAGRPEPPTPTFDGRNPYIQ